MKKISRVLAGIAAAAMMLSSIPATVMAAETPEIMKTFFGRVREAGFYEKGDLVNGTVCLQLDNSTSMVFPDGTMGSATNRSVKLKITNDTDTAESYQHWGNISTPYPKYCYAATDTDNMALQFYINIRSQYYEKMTAFKVGLTCVGAETTDKNCTYATMTTDAFSLLDSRKTDDWQQVTVPLSDIKNGTFDANTLSLEAFDWNSVAGMSFIIENGGLRVDYLNPALWICDVRLVKLPESGGTVTEPKAAGIAFYNGDNAKVESLEGQTGVSAKVTLEYPEAMQGANSVVLIASYKGTEGARVLDNVLVKPVTLGASQTEFSTDVLAVSSDDTMVKAYVWYDLETAQPWQSASGLVNAISR